MDDRYLTLSQALQMVGLGPSLLLVAFLALTLKHPSHIVVPILFFLSLAASFSIPLLPLFYDTPPFFLSGVLLMFESMMPAFGFLLIIQMIQGRIPALIYWLILCVPLIGGSSILYIALITNDEVCVYESICLYPQTIKTLYAIFSSSVILLLTVALFIRRPWALDMTISKSRHQYWMVLSLIVLSTLLLAIDLAELSGDLSASKHMITVTLARIAYIYMVSISMFRIFDHQFEIDAERIPSAKAYVITHEDEALVERVSMLLAHDKIYREMAISREKLAQMVGVSEHQLSKVINRAFGKNFNRMINGFRVAEAKERLASEQTSITVIAFEVGFNSIASFNRVFKEEVGVSPTEFRESAKLPSVI